MNTIFKMLSKAIMAACLCLLLFACSRVTQDNFNKIRPNMTLQEVTAILGEPTTANSIDIGGISGTAAVWRTGDIEINIQFLNDRVLLKNFSKDGSSPMPKINDNNAAPNTN